MINAIEVIENFLKGTSYRILSENENYILFKWKIGSVFCSKGLLNKQNLNFFCWDFSDHDKGKLFYSDKMKRYTKKMDSMGFNEFWTCIGEDKDLKGIIDIDKLASKLFLILI